MALVVVVYEDMKGRVILVVVVYEDMKGRVDDPGGGGV